jgi:hypothetical protein
MTISPEESARTVRIPVQWIDGKLQLDDGGSKSAKNDSEQDDRTGM